MDVTIDYEVLLAVAFKHFELPHSTVPQDAHQCTALGTLA